MNVSNLEDLKKTNSESRNASHDFHELKKSNADSI